MSGLPPFLLSIPTPTPCLPVLLPPPPPCSLLSLPRSSPARTGEGTHRHTQVALGVLAELAVTTVGLVRGEARLAGRGVAAM